MSTENDTSSDPRFVCGYVTVPEDRPALPYSRTRAYLHCVWLFLECIAYEAMIQSVESTSLEIESEIAGPAMLCGFIVAPVSALATLIVVAWMCRQQDIMSFDGYLSWFWARVALLPAVVTLFATVYWFGESLIWAVLLALASLAAIIAIIADTWCILCAERWAFAAEYGGRARETNP